MELDRRHVDAHHEIGQTQVVPDLHLSAGFPQHPGTDVHHQARLFGNADEAARRHQPELRMSPAQQRFGAHDPAACQVELRLEVQHQFVLCQRRAQSRDQLNMLLHADVHVVVEVAHGIAASGLGAVHRHVGLLQQLVEITAVVRVEGNAERSRTRYHMAVDVKWRRELGEQLDADFRDVVLIADVDQQDQELVAALAAHGVAGAQIVPVRRWLTSRSSSSPWGAPSESLMCLKSSRSRKSTARPEWRAGVHRRLLEAVPRQRRFGRPVRIMGRQKLDVGATRAHGRFRHAVRPRPPAGHRPAAR